MDIERQMVTEAKEMALRLRRRFGKTNLTFAPECRGCGVLTPCQADFIVGNELVEVKGGYRAFRSADFRQVLIYATLIYLDRSHELDRFTLINVRLMREISLTLDEFCAAIAGNSSIEIYSRIADFLSAGIASGV